MRFEFSAYLTRCVLMLSVGLMAMNLAALAARFPQALGVAGLYLTWRRLRRRAGGGDAYGSARPSTIGELYRHNMLGDDGLILGTCGYMERPTRREGLRALFSRRPSPLACRLFLAAFFGRTWLER